MPLFSAFTGFGFFEFSSEPSEHEKMYNALVLSYRDPRTGRPTIDTSVGTFKEAQLYGWAGALGGARVNLRRAGNELRPETSYCSLEAYEEKYQMSPAATDTVSMRRAALAAKQKAARGPRYEAVWEALGAILGDSLVAYRPISTSEAVAYPATLRASPGLFRRPDAVAKSVRLLTAVTRTNEPYNVCDEYDESNQDAGTILSTASTITAAAQSFSGNGKILSLAQLHLAKSGSPTGYIYAKIYDLDGSGFPDTLLATSDRFNASTLTGSYVLYDFNFSGADQITLPSGTNNLALVLEYTGSAEVDWGSDASAPAHAGAASAKVAGVWTAEPTYDHCFHIRTGYAQSVFYENWNRSLVEQLIVPGDVLCVDPGNWGLVERVTVIAAEGSGTTRKFTAAFRQPHSTECYVTTGPTPLWANTKRHVLIVVTAAASISTSTVRRIDELFKRIMRGPTTWAIVQETTPGSGTTGPFKIGATSGSPLGAVALESITL